MLGCFELDIPVGHAVVVGADAVKYPDCDRWEKDGEDESGHDNHLVVFDEERLDSPHRVGCVELSIVHSNVEWQSSVGFNSIGAGGFSVVVL